MPGSASPPVPGAARVFKDLTCRVCHAAIRKREETSTASAAEAQGRDETWRGRGPPEACAQDGRGTGAAGRRSRTFLSPGCRPAWGPSDRRRKKRTRGPLSHGRPKDHKQPCLFLLAQLSERVLSSPPGKADVSAGSRIPSAAVPVRRSICARAGGSSQTPGRGDVTRQSSSRCDRCGGRAVRRAPGNIGFFFSFLRRRSQK